MATSDESRKQPQSSNYNDPNTRSVIDRLERVLRQEGNAITVPQERTWFMRHVANLSRELETFQGFDRDTFYRNIGLDPQEVRKIAA